MRVIGSGDIVELLTMGDAIAVLERAMIAVSQGRADLPLRTIVPAGPKGRLGLMPGAMRDPPCFGLKLVSLFPENPAAGLSSHTGLMVLMEQEHGRPLAALDGAALTAVRTAAASALATDRLARAQADTLALIGYGEQAASHLDGMRAVRPIRHVRVAGRDAARAAAFAERMAARYGDLEIAACASAKDAVAGADIVCTVTGATEPVLFGAWVRPGTHVNAVGASVPSKRELDEAMLTKARLFVDYRPSTLAQAGEVIAALEAERIDDAHIRAEIGEVLAGERPGRTHAREITLYRSLGIAAQDLACAWHVLGKAEEQGRGTWAPLD